MDTTLIHPIVTVILPVYNGGVYLATAIQSVLDQRYTAFELLIIDDGSTDDSLSTIRNFTDPRIRLIEHPNNRKLIATLNEGLTLARGNYIARIDSDDIWTDQDKLTKQIAFLEKHPQYALIGTQGIAIDHTGRKLFTLHYPTTDTAIRKQLLSKNCFIHSSVVFRKDAAQKASGFLAEEKYAEDYGLWLRIGSYYNIANVNDTAVSYRINTQGVTQNNNLAQISMCLSIIAKHRQDYPHYRLAKIRWSIRKVITQILGTELFETIKRKIKF